jgi:hypothetical protein
MMMIMYYAFNFMNDEFDDSNNSDNFYNFGDYCYNDTEKCNAYEYVLSNFTQSSYLLSNQNQEIVEKFVYNNYLNNCINVLIVFFVTSTSLLFSILIVSICVYEKMINQFVEKYNENRETYEYDTYFFEYLDEFNELTNVEFIDNNSYTNYLNLLEHKYIKQKTPKGEVLMNYNNSNSSFDYYCKKSNSIDFLYLDVVSRIYVVKYNCKNIYVDNYDNFELIKSYYSNLSNESYGFDELKENNIFYNRINKKNKTKQPIEYVSNKYKYRGTFDDFNSYCKNNNYKIHTKDLLENDVFVLEKIIEITKNNRDGDSNGDSNGDGDGNGDKCLNSKITMKDSNDISFKTFKNMYAMSCKN